MFRFTALCTILPWMLLGAHVHKTTYGPLFDTALYVMFLIWTNPLLGHWKGWAMKILTFMAQPFQWPL